MDRKGHIRRRAADRGLIVNEMHADSKPYMYVCIHTYVHKEEKADCARTG